MGGTMAWQDLAGSGWVLICWQLASLLLHAICNLQSATQSLLNNGKMKLLENDCQTAQESATARSTHTHIAPAPFPHATHTNRHAHTYFSSTKCLASSGCFYVADTFTLLSLRLPLLLLFLGSCFVAATWQHFLLLDWSIGDTSLRVRQAQKSVSIIKRQHIKFKAYFLPSN